MGLPGPKIWAQFCPWASMAASMSAGVDPMAGARVFAAWARNASRFSGRWVPGATGGSVAAALTRASTAASPTARTWRVVAVPAA